MHVPVRLTTASAASAASAALADYTRAPRDGAYEAASMTDAGPPHLSMTPPSRKQKPPSPPQPVTRDPGEASTATLHNPAAESRTSSTSSGATLHAAFETPDPEPSASFARQRRQALRPLDCGLPVLLLPVAQNVSVGSRFYAHLIGRQHREKAAADQFRTNDKWLLDVRARQDAPRLQRERLRKIKAHFLLSTESASRVSSARNPRPASPVRRRPTSPEDEQELCTVGSRTDQEQGKAAMAPGADASVFAYYPSAPRDGAYKAADKGAAARRTNFLSQTTYHICGKISLGGIEGLNQHLPPAVRVLCNNDHQHCTSWCRDSRPDDEPERPLLAHDGPLLAHLADQEHFHKAIPVQVNVKCDAHGEQILCLQHVLPGAEPTQSASLRLSALTMSRYWGCPSSTQRIIELGVPGYEQVGSIYLKLGSYACIKRLANLVGLEDFE